MLRLHESFADDLHDLEYSIIIDFVLLNHGSLAYIFPLPCVFR